MNIKPFKLQNYPVYDFYNNEDIIYTNIDAIEIIQDYFESDDKIFLIDPPYIKSFNSYYNNFNIIYYSIVKQERKLPALISIGIHMHNKEFSLLVYFCLVDVIKKFIIYFKI